MIPPSQIEPLELAAYTGEHVWYASYGSNMHLARFLYYVQGGKPPGGARTYPGCRDTTPPVRSAAVMLPGQMYFALESRAWTGGMAFYDATENGLVAARAYLITIGQFSDVVAQETYQATEEDLDLTQVLMSGREEIGQGRYETLVCPGQLEGLPVLTFTAPWRKNEVQLNKPAGMYLSHLATGLVEAHGWTVAEVAEYLICCPGVAGEWISEEVERLIL